MENGSRFDVPEHPEELRKRAVEELHLGTDQHILLFVGHQIWHKNLKLVLDTVRSLCDESDDYTMVIVGNGYDQEDVLEYARSLCFPEGKVLFPGRITDRDLLKGVMLASNLFFFPSVYDNAPLVVREAASVGLPSLLVAGSNAAEAVVPNETGFTAAENVDAMKQEIKRIFGTPGLLEKVGKGAQQNIPVSWETIISRVREAYARIIEEYSQKNT